MAVNSCMIALFTYPTPIWYSTGTLQLTAASYYNFDFNPPYPVVDNALNTYWCKLQFPSGISDSFMAVFVYYEF